MSARAILVKPATGGWGCSNLAALGAGLHFARRGFTAWLIEVADAGADEFVAVVDRR